MIPALIDLHVRPQADGDGTVDYAALAEQARSKGLDGLVLFGTERGEDLASANEITRDLGVLLFTGVELDTEHGRLLCLPREADEWFTGGGWRALAEANGGGPAVYAARELIAAFTERGGAVIVAQPFDRDLSHPCGEEAFTATEGLAAVVVASNPKHALSNDKALRAARKANLPCVAGSAAHPGAAHFGSVATIFATPPSDQALLVEALRQGRVWPVEIGVQPPGADKSDDARAKQRTPPAEERPRDPPRKQKGRRKRGGDDNRGNRLSPATRGRPETSTYDTRQPDFDPIARLYGIDARRSGKLSKLSDEELDRINGNRARGPDPNVMSRPDFSELRAERHHISLLLATIDPRTRADEDSISLRFAVANAGEAAAPPPPQPTGGRRRPQGGNANARGTRRRRGRRRR